MKLPGIGTAVITLRRRHMCGVCMDFALVPPVGCSWKTLLPHCAAMVTAYLREDMPGT